MGSGSLERVTGVRPGEFRAAGVAALTLGAIMVAHELLEIARDTIFLQRLPPTRLPWVYLMLAGIGVVVSLRGGPRISRRLLTMSLLVSAIVTAAFWWLVGKQATWAFYALYVWTGLFASVIIAQFWLLLDEVYTATEAKRIFGFIALGGIVGAVLGSALAQQLATFLPIRSLILVGSGVLLLSCGGAWLLRHDTVEKSEEKEEPSSVRRSFLQVGEHPYSRRVAVLTLLSTLTLTLVDYVFKSIVVQEVSREELGSFFATVSVLANVGSFVVQLLFVRWLLWRFGLTSAIVVFPFLLLGGALGLALGGGVIAAAALKGVDGSLRHSLHQTTKELLFVPMSDRIRGAMKLMNDLVIRRGGQALASGMILIALWLFEPSPIGFALVASILAAAWLVVVFGLKPHYLNLFRQTLAQQSLQTRLTFPDFKLRSLEALIEALNSSEDSEVLAALNLLEEEERHHLIPAVMVHHSSEAVALRAVEILSVRRPEAITRSARRLMDHEAPPIRAAVMRLCRDMKGAAEHFERLRHDEAPIVRATALVSLAMLEEDVQADLIKISVSKVADERRALAQAIRQQPDVRFIPSLLELASNCEPWVLGDVAAAMNTISDVRFISALIDMLEHRAIRDQVRQTLVGYGDEALAALDQALDDEERRYSVRLHIPRTISRFPPERAVPILLERMLHHSDGRIRFKSLRGLGRIKAANSQILLDRKKIEKELHRTVESAFEALHWRYVLGSDEARRETATGKLLQDLLRDQETMHAERAFRLLALLRPEEFFRQIHFGLRSPHRGVRSSSLELVSSLLPSPLREALIGLSNDAFHPNEEKSAQRLAQAGSYYEAKELSYTDVVLRMMKTSNVTLSAAAAYHASEIELEEAREEIRDLLESPSSSLVNVAKEALALFAGRPVARA